MLGFLQPIVGQNKVVQVRRVFQGSFTGGWRRAGLQVRKPNNALHRTGTPGLLHAKPVVGWPSHQWLGLGPVARSAELWR